MRSARLQLNPEFPLCWEGTETLRFGFEQPRLRLQSPTPAQQRFISELIDGINDRELPSIAQKCGLSALELTALLSLLEPVLAHLPASRHPSRTTQPRRTHKPNPEVLVFGAGEFVTTLCDNIAQSGVTVASRAPTTLSQPAPRSAPIAACSFAIIVERFLGPTAVPQALYGEGVPHLPICLTDTSMSIGPLVLPGGSPCLACVEQHRVDAEPKIAVFATQLLGLSPAAESPHCAELAAAIILVAFRRWQQNPESTQSARMRFPVQRGFPEFRSSFEVISPHPECACALFR
jgi:hypothetical protein